MPALLGPILRHAPSSWTDLCYNGEPCRCVPLNSGSAEYERVRALFNETLCSAVPMSIERVQNPHLYGLYLLKKSECVARNAATRERSLWHATSLVNARRIVRTNLDWRRAKRVKFGKGVSFSPSAKYANMECSRNTPTYRACILCKVLEGASSKGHYDTVLPVEGCDTTTGRKGMVAVKYADDEFYPEYVVHYKSPAQLG